MTINYGSLLTDEQKREILNQRISQFANEAFQHTLNKQVAESANNEEAVKAADDALAILESAITIHQEELSKLPTE